MDNRFPKFARLLKRREFSFEKPTRREHRTRLLVVSTRLRNLTEDQSALPPSPRLGITVSKRADKRAVGRNYFKRCIREAFRHLRPTLRSDLDIHIIARKGATRSSFHELYDALVHSLKKLGYVEHSRERT